jgi:hypothetical protein
MVKLSYCAKLEGSVSRKLLFFVLPLFLLLLLVPKTDGQNDPSVRERTVATRTYSLAAMPLKLREAQPPVKMQATKLQRSKRAKTASGPLDTVRITSKFGPRKHPVLKRRSFHNGVDLAATLNDKVKTISDGIVVYSGARGALGNAVFVSHPKLKVTSIYGHLNKVAVRKGEKVSAGNVIGYAGTTGRSTGVHLHLTVKDQRTGSNIEPVRYLSQVAVQRQIESPAVIAELRNKNRVSIAKTATKPKLARSTEGRQETSITSLQLAIKEAAAKAVNLENLYSEGIVARNKYLEAQSTADKLRQQLQFIQEHSGSS